MRISAATSPGSKGNQKLEFGNFNPLDFSIMKKWSHLKIALFLLAFASGVSGAFSKVYLNGHAVAANAEYVDWSIPACTPCNTDIGCSESYNGAACTCFTPVGYTAYKSGSFCTVILKYPHKKKQQPQYSNIPIQTEI